MNKLCRNALASCLTVSLTVGGGIAVPAASGTSLEQDTAVAGMAVSLDNYYTSSQTPEADIIDYIRYIVSVAKEKKAIPVVTVNAVTKKDGSVVFGTDLVSKDASEKEDGLVSVMASLNVRNKPSVSSSVVGYLYSNCVVSIYDTIENDEGSWYLIKSGDVEGYVSSDYVLTGAAAKASEEDLTNRYAKVTAKRTTVYSSASSSADSVGTVYKDGDYKVLEIQNGFVKIAVNEEFAGFVRAKDVSLYTRHAEAVAITDQMVKSQLDSYLVDIRDAEAIFEKRMAAADYQAAYNASTYAYQLWDYYINDASNAGYTDLVNTAKSEQKKTADMVARATAALNGETIPETSSEAATSQEETSPTQPDSSSADPTEPTTSTTAEETTPTTVEETTSTTAEETTSTTVEETTSTTAEETTATTVEETTSTTAEETTATTVEETTSTTAEETTSTTVEETTSTTAEETTSTTAEETVRAIQSIEVHYTGSSKTEGEVISASELYIVVTYTDGTTETVTEGWSCDQVGMLLSAGVNTITVNYQGFSSSFEVNVATIAPSTETPTSTSQEDTSSETVPDDTTASVEEPTSTTAEETQPSASEEPTTSTTAQETTTTTTAEETTTTTVEETTTTTTAEETTTTTTAEETTTPSNNSTPLRDALVNYALSWVGQCNYVYGGTDLSVGGSVDCSGFTMQVYSRVAGVGLPHHSMSQMNCGSAISYDQLRPGDLVFYNNPNHVAIYIGNGAIVHAGSPETGINVTSVFFKTPIGYRTYLP